MFGEKFSIFCGAGVSIPAGLPPAIPLLRKVATAIDLTADQIEKVMASGMPFERFFERRNGPTAEASRFDGATTRRRVGTKPPDGGALRVMSGCGTVARW